MLFPGWTEKSQCYQNAANATGDCPSALWFWIAAGGAVLLAAMSGRTKASTRKKTTPTTRRTASRRTQ